MLSLSTLMPFWPWVKCQTSSVCGVQRMQNVWASTSHSPSPLDAPYSCAGCTVNECAVFRKPSRMSKTSVQEQHVLLTNCDLAITRTLAYSNPPVVDGKSNMLQLRKTSSASTPSVG